MNIIDKSKNTPIMVHKPKPTFRTELELQRYWAKEKERWINGYNGIPGTLYHYIQEQFIKDRTSGKTLRPICRDSDLLIHEKIQEQRKLNRALGIIKGRGAGLSSIGGALANYFMRVYPGSTSLVTSKEQSAISNLFSEKIMVPFNNYDPDIRPTILNKNETKSAVYLKAQIKFRDESGTPSIGESQVICRETSDKPSSATAFSGTGAIYGFYDELPLNRRRSDLIKSSISCYRNSLTNVMEGFLLFGGTCEENLSNEDLAQFQTMINDAEMWDADILFIPFWMGKFMDKNGISSEKLGMEWWDKEAEKLSKAEDKSLLIAHKKNNPRTLDDIFEFGNTNRWEDDVSEKIKLQHKKVIAANIPTTKCKLVEIGGRVETEVNSKGNVTILENPKQGVEYYLCVDGVATGTEVGGASGSNVAGTIVKLFDPSGDSFAPVCIYTERPTTVEQSYITLLNQAKYYDKFNGFKGISAEANAGTADHFSVFLNRHGYRRWIIHSKDLSGKGYSNTKKSFQYITTSGRDWQMRQANIFLRKNIEVIKMTQLLVDMMKPAVDNADILDSWLMFFIAAGADFDKPVVKKPLPIKQRRVVKVDKNGMTYIVWENV